DRLHNMRTLEHLDDEKQRRIALETREIYAPLAHRFGMAGVKAELEDLAFKFLERDDYRGLSRKVRAKKVERERTIERLRAPLGDALREASLADIEITGRPKNLWSIYKKMKKRDKPFEEIYDLLAWFRQLIELQQDTHTPEEFLEFLKVDLYQDEIFVFTPRGDVKRLPKGATPLDFAFAVHTEVGQHCQGARINGRIAPLHRPLK